MSDVRACGEQDRLERDLFGIAMPTRAQYIANLTNAGFTEIEFEDVTTPWRELTVGRAAKYVAERASHVAVHGEATVDGLTTFYTSVAQLFETGKMGGVRLRATRGSGAHDEV